MFFSMRNSSVSPTIKVGQRPSTIQRWPQRVSRHNPPQWLPKAFHPVAWNVMWIVTKPKKHTIYRYIYTSIYFHGGTSAMHQFILMKPTRYLSWVYVLLPLVQVLWYLLNRFHYKGWLIGLQRISAWDITMASNLPWLCTQQILFDHTRTKPVAQTPLIGLMWHMNSKTRKCSVRTLHTQLCVCVHL